LFSAIFRPETTKMNSRPDTRLRRLPERGLNDFASACAVIDAARICHAGIAVDGQPYVLPMACARDGRRLLMHGSIASRLVKQLGGGLPVCVTITHLDGLVLARSAFNSSMNYRSVMVFGTAVAITDAREKTLGLDILTDQLAPGRRAEIRASNRKELAATSLLALPIETFTVKVRTGPPEDLQSDLEADVWAGVIPFTQVSGTPVPAPDLVEGIEFPEYLARV